MDRLSAIAAQRTSTVAPGHSAGAIADRAILEQKGNGEVDPNHNPSSNMIPPRRPLEEGWQEERLLDDDGKEILIRYRGGPSRARYEFIRDYLDFKLKRMKVRGEAEVP
jgi:hypothetical protein